MNSLMKNMQTITNNLNSNNLLIFIDAPFSIIFLIAVYFLHYQLGLILTIFLIVPFIISNFLHRELLKRLKIIQQKVLNNQYFIMTLLTKISP